MSRKVVRNVGPSILTRCEGRRGLEFIASIASQGLATVSSIQFVTMSVMVDEAWEDQGVGLAGRYALLYRASLPPHYQSSMVA